METRTRWGRILKSDVMVAKNYLDENVSDSLKGPLPAILTT